jgi:ribosome-associated toxin RatA of RatAB toxin-antitoxin module
MLHAVLALLLLAAPALAADPNTPHPHQGIVTPFRGKPAVPALAPEELATLQSGGQVLKTIQMDEGGRGLAIQDIQADPARIWGRILDYGAYPRMVSGVYECGVYQKAGEHVKARFVIGKMGIKYEYYIDHIVHTDQGYLTWTLDYSRTSDLDESVGFWRVEPAPDHPGYTRVYYSVDVRVSGVPAWIENMLAKQGLKDATEWVKRESEAAG